MLRALGMNDSLTGATEFLGDVMGKKSSTNYLPFTYLQRFRKTYRRIDYYPGDAALEAIKSMKAKHQDESFRAILDALVLSGYRSLTKDVGLFPESNKA